MKKISIKRSLRTLLSLFIIAIVAFIGVRFINFSHAQTPPPSYTCTWTGSAGGHNDFSVAANWSGCNNAAPLAGDYDNLVFDNTSWTQQFTALNDIPALNVNSITLQGTGAIGLNILSGPFNIGAGGLSVTATAPRVGLFISLTNVRLVVTLSASQTWQTTDSGSINISNPLQVGNYNLTTNGNVSLGSGDLEGTGTLIVDHTSPYDTSGVASLEGNQSNFSGPIIVKSGQLNAGFYNATDNPFGSGNITVDNGGEINIIDDTGTGVSSYTLPNNLSLSGSGISSYPQAAIEACISRCTPTHSSPATLILSGTVSLAGNTTVANFSYEAVAYQGNLAYTFSHPVTYNGYSISVATHGNASLSVPTSGATSNASKISTSTGTSAHSSSVSNGGAGAKSTTSPQNPTSNGSQNSPAPVSTSIANNKATLKLHRTVARYSIMIIPIAIIIALVIVQYLPFYPKRYRFISRIIDRLFHKNNMSGPSGPQPPSTNDTTTPPMAPTVQAEPVIIRPTQNNP
ncbi:MAG TPA: hypothetical protein VIH90_00090 [Candidatus Saccharimonadales bacterium]